MPTKPISNAANPMTKAAATAPKTPAHQESAQASKALKTNAPEMAPRPSAPSSMLIASSLIDHASPADSTLNTWGGPRSPLWSVQQLSLLMGNYTTRHCHNSITATVSPKWDLYSWSGLIAMQQATIDRLMQQQLNGWNGFMQLMQERKQLKQANTLSKWFEQEYNWFANISALMASQTTNLVNLMENIQFDYGYWMAQRNDPH
jgi:hypothetical protein